MKTVIFILALMAIDLQSDSTASIQVSYSKEQLQTAVYKTAKKKRMNPNIALAIAEVESTWNPNAVRYEPKGNTYSVGLFQMYMPTAKDLGFVGDLEALKKPGRNITLGVEHLAKCQRKHGNDVRRVACCHNAGLYIRDSVCKNDTWVIHYQNKVEKAYKTYKGVF